MCGQPGRPHATDQAVELAGDFCHTRQRTGLLARLEPLPPAAWTRSATITGAGRPLQWSVWFYAQRMARHERQHLTQLQAIAAALA